MSVRERKGRITSLLLRDRVALLERNRGRRRVKTGGVTGAETEKQRDRWCDSEWEEVKLTLKLEIRKI